MMKIVQKVLIFIIFTKSCVGFTPPKFDPETDVYFLLRIQNREFSKEEAVNLAQKEGLEKTAFDPSKPILFHVHGFIEDRKKPTHLLLDKTILEKADMNLFFVDWGKGAKTIDYGLARSRVDGISKVIGEFINYINAKHGLSPSNSCCIGFSLGAHICGLIHVYVTDGKLNKVYGLDPAGLLFDVNDPSTRISPDSASYVECIHTGFPLGIRSAICQTDFFVNKGTSQPGCSNLLNKDNFACSHNRAIQFFMEAIKTPNSFYGKLCSSQENAMLGNCEDEPGAFMVGKENREKQLTGIYHVITNEKVPFGRGKE
ncbi:unnamed protein product [Chironomus riparius]|uniref:Lipase domain-containing protein n=1 Tax=Chironomus riparius TaxID=315576 RepID=A0A9N9S5D5_9DIPT|nr:unnamed protein product [Chironomus riparius]